MATTTEISEQSKARQKRGKVKRILFWVAVLAVLGALGGGGSAGWKMYKRVRQERVLDKAREFMAVKDYGQAAMSVSWALQMNSRDIEANRMMAELAELAGSNQALHWLRAVADLQPDVPENHLKLAETALRFNNPAVAEQALAKLSAAATTTPAYHDLAGRIAQASKQPANAESHFAEAVNLEPKNDTYRLHLAAARLQSADAAVCQQARADILALTENPELRRTAYRTLIQDALQKQEWSEAFSAAARLQGVADAPFEDRMLMLELLRKFQRPDLHTYLMDLQDACASKADQVAILINWLNRNTMALIAVDWSKGLPEDVRSQHPVPAAIAESYASLRNWTDLEPLVATGDWQELDFMRLALLARVLRENGDIGGSRTQWVAAVKAIAGRADALEKLAKFAIDSKWEAESTDLLWQIARGPSNQLWALMDLLRQYTAHADTRGMLNAYSRVLELDHHSSVAQNNVAALSFLLNSNVERAHTLARSAYAEDPANSAIATTYAYSLHLQGKTAEGLEVICKVNPNLLQQDPSYAAYYGILLSDAGSAEASLKYLDIATRGRLLPEEQALVAKTRAKLLGREADGTVQSKQ